MKGSFTLTWWSRLRLTPIFKTETYINVTDCHPCVQSRKVNMMFLYKKCWFWRPGLARLGNQCHKLTLFTVGKLKIIKKKIYIFFYLNVTFLLDVGDYVCPQLPFLLYINSHDFLGKIKVWLPSHQWRSLCQNSDMIELKR